MKHFFIKREGNINKSALLYMSYSCMHRRSTKHMLERFIFFFVCVCVYAICSGVTIAVLPCPLSSSSRSPPTPRPSPGLDMSTLTELSLSKDAKRLVVGTPVEDCDNEDSTALTGGAGVVAGRGRSRGRSRGRASTAAGGRGGGGGMSSLASQRAGFLSKASGALAGSDGSKMAGHGRGQVRLSPCKAPLISRRQVELLVRGGSFGAEGGGGGKEVISEKVRLTSLQGFREDCGTACWQIFFIGGRLFVSLGGLAFFFFNLFFGYEGTLRRARTGGVRTPVTHIYSDSNPNPSLDPTRTERRPGPTKRCPRPSFFRT